MKIAHISDLHISTEIKPSNRIKAEKILEYITDTGFDHLIISGDITENGDKSSLEYSRKLLKKFNLLDPDKLTLVIGNHDIFGGVNYAEDVIQFPKRCKQTNYEKKVIEFEYYFRESFLNSYQPDKSNLFPFAKELDNFLFIGLNTIAAYSILKNPFASNGKISNEQYKNLEKILSSKSFENKSKIIIAHHHFSKSYDDNSLDNNIWKRIEKQTMKLRNKKKIIDLFQKYNVRSCFHGHLHSTGQYFRKNIRFLNAGGSTLGYKNELKVNYLYIDPNETIFEIQSIPFKTSKKLALERKPKYNYITQVLPTEIYLN